MDAKVKQLWLTALNSGKYEQTRGYLHDDEGFCCLGVLCDIYNKETGKGEWLKGNYEAKIFRVDDSDTKKYTLPKEVQKWAGLPTSDGQFDEENVQEKKIPHKRYNYIASLVDANDGGYNFCEISQLIKQQF